MSISKAVRLIAISLVIAVGGIFSFVVSGVVLSFGGSGGQTLEISSREQQKKPTAEKKLNETDDSLTGGEQLIFSRGQIHSAISVL